MATASATSHSAGGKPSPAKGKIVLQKKPTKAALRKQQRDLLKECIQEFDSQDCEGKIDFVFKSLIAGLR